MTTRTLLLGGVLLAALMVPCRLASAQAQDADDTHTYVPPAGEAPPVAPPLKKGSPLDHLANDPKLQVPTDGFKMGKTTGTVYWIGHRHVDDVGGQGWGWMRTSDGKWSSAQWVTIQETMGLAEAPHRKLVKNDADEDYEYKFWGHFAPYKAYDPRLDEQLPVFVLEGYEVIGLTAPLTIKVGPSDRKLQRPSGASARGDRPILSDPMMD